MNKKISTFPLIIVLSGAIIAAGILYTNIKPKTKEVVEVKNIDEFKISDISKSDHILGNPNADVVIVHYSDFRCPFCAMFLGTIQRITQEYAPTSKSAWVYRHFSTAKTDSQEYKMMLVSECVAKLKNEKAFWDYINYVYGNSSIILENNNYYEKAISMGIDANQLDSCILNDKDIANKIQQDINDVRTLYKMDKNFGTPYMIFLYKSGNKKIIYGNQDYYTIKTLVDVIY